jgi:tRNA modification GTPase
MDPIEREGIRRARKEIEQADLLLYLTDAQSGEDKQHPLSSLGEWQEGLKLPPVILIRNKIDLTEEAPSLREEDQLKIISLSAKTNQGLDLLKSAIKTAAGFSLQQEGSFSARQRHLDALGKARHLLQNAYLQLKTTRAGELIAEDLRLAQNHLSEITGEFTTEDLLGRIFSSFCIGK